jgi:hypothetical protein
MTGANALANSKDDDGKQTAQEQKQSNQQQSKCETIRGEIASVSVLGETMVDYNTGRGVLAEMTYLTILGSPSDAKQGTENGDRQNEAKSGNKDSQGTTDEKGDHRGFWERRKVYQIAIGPDTEVKCQASHGKQNAADQDKSTQGSAHEKSQESLASLELGDRVKVEFDRLGSENNRADADKHTGASGNQSRHGRHRIIRGVARKVTILSTPSEREEDGKDHESHEQGNRQSKSKE